MTTPWDIYAEQLLPVGYGHPLWIPEPNVREVDIGDVGWLKEGEFRPLFNSMKLEDDEINAEKGVPPSFTVFKPPNVSIGQCDKISQPFVCSRSIRTIETQGDVAAGSSNVQATAGVGFRFQSTTDSGAFVVLEPPGRSKDIESKRHIVNYMRDHFDSWLEWANSSNSWGLDLKDQDIIFVCGTTKTSRWAVAAFQGNDFRRKEGHVSGDFGPYATARLSINISNQILPANHYRTGPSRVAGTHTTPSVSYPGFPTPTSLQSGQNQCLFIHYYKMKRRFWWPLNAPMQAAAGPHDLPPGPDNPGMDAPIIAGGSAQYEFEPEYVPGQGETYDPVNALLDHILQQSEAEYAIASDMDLIAIFMGGELPSLSELPAALQRLSPVVEVDERGVGTVSVNLRFKPKRRNDPEENEEAEDVRSSKRSRYDSGPVAGPSGHHGSSGLDAGTAPYSIPQDLQVPYRAQDNPHMGAPGAHLGDNVLAQYMSVLQEGAPYTQDMLLATPHAHPPPGTPYAPLLGGPHPPQDLLYSPQGIPHLPQGMPHPPQGTSYPLLPMPYPLQTPPAPTQGNADELFSPPLPSHPTPPAFPHTPPPNPPANHNDDDDDDDGERCRRVVMAQGSAHDGSVVALAYSADGRLAASGSEDTSIIMWDVYHNVVMHKVQGPEDTISSLAFSRDNRALASATHGVELVVWSVDTGAEMHRLQMGQAVQSVVYTPDGRYMVGGAVDGTVRVWDTREYQEVFVLEHHHAVVTFIVFSPDGRMMATGGTENVCCIWDTSALESRTPRWVLEGHTGMVCAAAFAPDGERIITASDDGSARIWKTGTGEELVILREHSGPVWAVAFSPNGKRVASGSSDSTVKVCDSFSGERLLSLDGHDSMVNAVEFSSDGKYIASAASDNTVRLWSAEDGTYVRTYNEHNDNVTTVMFSSDSRSIMSGSHDGTVRIRPLVGEYVVFDE